LEKKNENSFEVDDENDIVVVNLDETDEVDVSVLDDSINDGENVVELDAYQVDESIEVVDLDDTLEDKKIEFSIKDLVNIWAKEEWVKDDETVQKAPKRLPEENVSSRNNKKRRRDLKPRGL